MSTQRDFDRTAQAWLAEGPSELADRVLDAALDEVHLTNQRRRLAALPWRTFSLNTPLRVAAGIAIVAVLGFAALSFLGRGPGYGGAPTPGPTSVPSSTAATSPAATSLGAIDTTTWATYTSTRYGFSIGYPADWIVRSADHDWAFPADATSFPPTAGETFHTPAGGVAVSAYAVTVAPGTTMSAWLQAYCPVAESNSPCTALQSRPTSLDGHAGSIVRFTEDTQAYVLIGTRLYIVGCWRSESDPTVLPFGGASRLLDGFLSTMHLLPGGPAPTGASPAPS